MLLSLVGSACFYAGGKYLNYIGLSKQQIGQNEFNKLLDSGIDKSKNLKLYMGKLMANMTNDKNNKFFTSDENVVYNKLKVTIKTYKEETNIMPIRTGGHTTFIPIDEVTEKRQHESLIFKSGDLVLSNGYKSIPILCNATVYTDKVKEKQLSYSEIAELEKLQVFVPVGATVSVKEQYMVNDEQAFVIEVEPDQQLTNKSNGKIVTQHVYTPNLFGSGRQTILSKYYNLEPIQLELAFICRAIAISLIIGAIILYYYN